MRMKAIKPYLIGKYLSVMLLCLFALMSALLCAQSSLTGRLHDPVDNKGCTLAVITLLQANSMLVQYIRGKRTEHLVSKISQRVNP